MLCATAWSTQVDTLYSRRLTDYRDGVVTEAEAKSELLGNGSYYWQLHAASLSILHTHATSTYAILYCVAADTALRFSPMQCSFCRFELFHDHRAELVPSTVPTSCSTQGEWLTLTADASVTQLLLPLPSRYSRYLTADVTDVALSLLLLPTCCCCTPNTAAAAAAAAIYLDADRRMGAHSSRS
jgi:hypothetical protein